MWFDPSGYNKHTDKDLDWSIVSGKTGETRVDHVNLHGNNNINKADHGVFYGDPVTTTNNAWKNKGDIMPTTNNGADVYVIPYNNVGYSGGYTGTGQNLNNITIVTKSNTNEIITAYPSYNSSPKWDVNETLW